MFVFNPKSTQQKMSSPMHVFRGFETQEIDMSISFYIYIWVICKYIYAGITLCNNGTNACGYILNMTVVTQALKHMHHHLDIVCRLPWQQARLARRFRVQTGSISKHMAGVMCHRKGWLQFWSRSGNTGCQNTCLDRRWKGHENESWIVIQHMDLCLQPLRWRRSRVARRRYL